MKRQFYPLILCALCLSARLQAQQATAAPKPAASLAVAPAVPALDAAQRQLREGAWLINQQRGDRPPLKLQEYLQTSALWLTQDMALHNYCDHTDSKGRAPDSRIADYYGYGHITGEIITAQQATPAEAITYWMNSPDHQAKILSEEFNELGVGSYFSETSEHKTYWAIDFGRRAENFPLVINREKPDTDSTEVDLYIYGAGWAKRMRLSNDGKNWSNWMPYVTTLKWNLLAGNGQRTVYVEMVNKNGVSRKDQDTINLLPPTTLSKN